MRIIKFLSLLFISTLFVACDCKKEPAAAECCVTSVKEPYKKKYTNADFYKDGKLDPEVALQAYLDMFEYYGVPYSDFLKENLWISDFNLGDFENVGMGGIFWVNDSVHSYLGHEIYLLPGQMIVEHKHVATRFPAKFESWHPRHGMMFLGSIGEAAGNKDVIPVSQRDHVTVFNIQEVQVDEVVDLPELEAPHYLIAGPQGVIISEHGSYHDGAGLRFTNPNVEFIDVLSKK